MVNDQMIGKDKQMCKTYEDKLSDKVSKYSSKFYEMMWDFILESETVLYEDDQIVCIINPYKDGMLEINKSKANEYIDGCIAHEYDNPDCFQNLLNGIHWHIMYWGINMSEDEADEFLIKHGKKPYDWDSL